MLAGLAAMFLYRISPGLADPDIWHEMALAREALASGWVPMEDRFAYTPTVYPSVHHEWGAGLLAYLIAMTSGATGIVVAKYVLAFSLAVICWRCARRQGGSTAVLSFLAPLAILLADYGFSTIRAQMYSFLFCATLFYWLHDDRQGKRRWLLAWPMMFIAWVNLHGGFLVGAGLLGVYWLEQWLRRQPHRHVLWAVIATLPLVALTPYGIHYYRYIWHAITLPRPLVSEWAPLWQSANLHHIALFPISFLLLLYAVRQVGLRQAYGLPLVLATALAAALHQRLLPFYAIAWLCYCPGYLQQTTLGIEMDKLWLKRRHLLIGLWGVVAIILLWRSIPNQPWKLQIPGYRLAPWQKIVYPVGPVRYLRDNQFAGNLYVPFDHGGYVLWKLHPEVRVSIDGRYEVAYPAYLADENFNFYMGRQGWQDTLAAYPTDAVLVPRDLPVVDKMPSAQGWEEVYTDSAFVLYAKVPHRLPLVENSQPRLQGAFP
jgi:hypothetical protein